jgi:hypothetical protein
MTDAQRTPNVLFATPIGGGIVAHEFVHSMMNIQAHFNKLGWKMQFVTKPDGLVTRSRNGFANMVMRNEEFTHLLMIDADVTLAPEGIERIIRSGHDFVGCVVPFREVNWDKVRGHLDLVPDITAPEMRVIANQYALWYERKQKRVNGFVPVHAIGSAVMCISREALQKLADSGLLSFAKKGLHAFDGEESGWTFFDPFVDEEGVYLSEDYALCDRWRSIGGQVWADLETPTNHIGPVPIRGDIKASLEVASRAVKIAKERREASETEEQK